MKFTIKFVDLRGRQHEAFTNDERTAHTLAGQLSIQFDAAEVHEGCVKVTYSHGRPLS